MQDRKQILIDGVKKLLALKVPDEEIIANLGELGVTSEQAKMLIEEAKGNAPQKPVFAQKPSSQARQQEASEEGLMPSEEEELEQEIVQEEAEEPKQEPVDTAVEEQADVLAETIPEEAPEDEKELEEEGELFVEEAPEEKPEEKPTEKTSAKTTGKKSSAKETIVPVSLKSKKAVSKLEADEFAEIWKKGILMMVNQKLEEMKKIRDEVDAELEAHSAKIAKKEVDKVKVLFDSQKTLMLETVNTRLEQKTKELDKMLDAKISELKLISKTIKLDIAKLEKLRETQKDSLKTIEQKLADMDASKSKLLVQFNSELVKSQSTIEEFLQEAQKKVEEIDSRTSQTLELESTIVENLAKSVDAKISEAAEQIRQEVLESLKKDSTQKKERQF